MSFETVAVALISALFGGLISGGSVAGLLYRAGKSKLIDDLILIFIKRSEVMQARTELQNDIDAVGGKVTGAVSMASMAKDTADANKDSLIRLTESEKHISITLDRLDARMDKADQRGEQHTAMLNEITRRLDRNEHRRDGG